MARMNRSILTAAMLCGLLLSIGCKPREKEIEVVVQPTISAADIGRRIEILASDEFEGRAPATPGGERASQYIADEMKAIGLEPMGVNGTYFQPITLTEMTLSVDSNMEIGTPEAMLPCDFPEKCVYWTKRFSDSVTVTNSDLVFVGYGIVAPEYNWDDYADIDVKGKTVVMLVNDPGFATQDPELFKGNIMTYYGRWTYKYEEAARQGAAGAIIIHETEPASYGWKVVADSWSEAQIDLVRPDKGEGRAAVEGWFHHEYAETLFRTAGLDLAELKAAAAQAGFQPVKMGDLTMNAQLNSSISTVKSRNIIGGIKGTTRPDEYVLYMGHWDHLAMKDLPDGQDGIYNGAVDNATGIASILEIGEAFAQKPAERSVIVVAVTAEESGLLGSAYYAEDPIVPLNKTVAGINIDGMLPLGLTKDIVVVGYGASELDDYLESNIKPKGMYITPDPKPEAGYYYRSDHISLAKKGLPMMYADVGVDHEIRGKEYGEAFGDEYVKERYHSPADEYDNSWDLSGLEQITEIFYELGDTIANSDDWPNWYANAEFRSLRDQMMAESQ